MFNLSKAEERNPQSVPSLCNDTLSFSVVLNHAQIKLIGCSVVPLWLKCDVHHTSPLSHPQHPAEATFLL